ncbi:MAG TPA: AsmA-like C-terminal region-containing protein, partial [Burkholderiales bacterium]
MDRKTVLTKTAKGLMEVTGKTSLLARDQRSLLSHVDGKATVGDLQHKVEKLSEAKLNQLLGRLVRDGFVREFVSAPNSLSPPSQLGTRHDLDFSEFIPQDKAREAAVQAAEAVQIARAVQESRARAEQADAQRAAQQAQPAAADTARQEAEARAKAKRIAEDNARRELVAKVKREAEEKARQEAEAKARREAEEKAHREAEAKAKREAEEKARRDAEAKAKQEAEEKARKAAEAKAKHDAEEKARKEAEAKVKRDAEEKARRDADAKAKQEAEEKARKAAEAKAKREAEEKAHREAEAAVEQARIEAEEQARREAGERAENARRGWQVRAEQERADQMRREAEEENQREAEKEAKQRLLEDERTRARADAERAARERREQRAREKAEADARAAERKRERERESATVVARLNRIRRGKSGGVGKWLTGLLVVALAIGVLAVPFLPVDTARYERLAERAFGVPVEIGNASYAWTPWPALELDSVSIGPAREARIGKGVAVPTVWSLLSGSPVLQRLDLQGVSAKPAALAALLSGKLDVRVPALREIGLTQVSLDAPGVTLPALHGRIELGSASSGGKLMLADGAGTLSLDIMPRGDGTASFELHAADVAALLGIPLTDVAAKGSFSAEKADVGAFDGRLHDGVLKGQGVLDWDPQLSFKGTVNAISLTAVKVTPVVEGRLSGSAEFSMQAVAFDNLFAAPHLNGRFEIEKGVLHGFDLPRSMQAGSVVPGATSFDGLNGQLALENGQLRLHNVRMQAGVMKASGTAVLAGGKEIDGRIAAELRIPAGHVR